MNDKRTSTGGGVPTAGEGPSVISDKPVTEGDLDALFEVLADRQRRRILTYLDRTEDDVAAFSELIEYVAERSDADSEELAVSLHHTHLPRLADADLVEYDDRSETVRYRGGDAVTDWLGLAEEYQSEP